MLPFQVLLFQDFTLGLCVLLAADHVVIILVAVVQDLVLVLQHWGGHGFLGPSLGYHLLPEIQR